MTSTRIEDMFDLHRFQEQQEFHKILLYLPFGLIILLTRLALGILIIPFLTFLPKVSRIRCCILRGLSPMLGVVVKQDERNWNDCIKLLISNHISVLDHFVVSTIQPCKLVNGVQSRSWSLPLFLRSFEMDSMRNEMSSNIINTLKKHISDSEVPVLIFPEETTTNGRVGLLKFNTWPFALNHPLQPIIIEAVSNSFISISPSVAGTSMWYDLLWLLFVPYTVFSIRALPVMEKIEKETLEEFSKRVQHTMAAALNLAPTAYTPKDKSEYNKRLQTTSTMQHTYARERLNISQRPELSQMARQVKEILPSVPVNVILQDLDVTKSIDATVSRLLEGVVHYIPEPIPSSSSASTESIVLKSSPSSSASAISSQMNVEGYTKKTFETLVNFPHLNTAAKNFGTSSKERMLSYQERKTLLIKNARIRYIQKHGMI